MTVTLPERTIRLAPRVLYLTADTRLVREQLRGKIDLGWDPERPRMDDVSTDEITPAWACFFFDQTLGGHVYTGLREGSVRSGEVESFGPSVVVSGRSKGCGSSREASPYAELCAGIRLIIADSFEKIYRQNAVNIGLLTSTDMELVPRILAGERIPLKELSRGLDSISEEIVLRGGLPDYERARLSGRVEPPVVRTVRRPMTLTEKIIARSVVRDAAAGRTGVPAVAPGQAHFIRADVRFSHEYVTAMAASIFERGFGPEARVAEPESCYLFRDHLTFLEEVMPRRHREMGLLERACELAVRQEELAGWMGIRLLGETEEGGSEAICHNAILEEIGLPGQVIVGTDSHTCTAGALGALGLGVGSTDMAAAWYTRDVRVKVPESVRVWLTGTMPPGVTAKDFVLYLMTDPYVAAGGCVGKALEIAGPGLAALSIDERATVANMAVETGAFTGIMAPDEVTFEWLASQRPELDLELARDNAVPASDDGAGYAHQMVVDLGCLEPMIARPGSPRNAISLSRLDELEGGRVHVDIAYGGSCTGGKMHDMDMYAAVLGAALERGERVARGVELFIQLGSRRVKRYARRMGHLEVFERVGARVLDPACGACIGAGPGVSTSEETVTVSAINRNFPGRSGPGRVFLASPLVVASSALKGYITGPEPGVTVHGLDGAERRSRLLAWRSSG